MCVEFTFQEQSFCVVQFFNFYFNSNFCSAVPIPTSTSGYSIAPTARVSIAINRIFAVCGLCVCVCECSMLWNFRSVPISQSGRTQFHIDTFQLFPLFVCGVRVQTHTHTAPKLITWMITRRFLDFYSSVVGHLYFDLWLNFRHLIHSCSTPRRSLLFVFSAFNFIKID